jgi:hypothetical protein
MIEIGGNVAVGGQIVIGNIPIYLNDFISEDGNFLVSQIDQNFVEEQ